MSEPSAVALIPARTGSKRVPDKNIRRLAGHPVLAYTICAARESGVFAEVLVATDSERYAEIARHYGASVPFLRPAGISGDASPDIEWVRLFLERLRNDGRSYDCFAILRPTSPFRLPATIQRAWSEFLTQDGIDSLRAVEPVKQHPGKMWVVTGQRMLPLLPFKADGQPWHSRQTATLPAIHVQNASLEIAWSRVVFDQGTIAGTTLMPFITQGHEGLDINDEEDWHLIQAVAAEPDTRIPRIDRPAYEEKP